MLGMGGGKIRGGGGRKMGFGMAFAIDERVHVRDKLSACVRDSQPRACARLYYSLQARIQ